MVFNAYHLKKKSPWLLLLTWIITLNLPSRFMHIGGHQGIEPYILFLLLIVVLPCLTYHTFMQFGMSDDNAMAWAIGSILFIMPFGHYKNHQSEQELAQYQRKTKGIVTKAWMQSRRRDTDVWAVQVKYRVNGKNYETSPQEDADRSLHKGETVTVLYSSKTPENAKIKELVERYEQ